MRVAGGALRGKGASSTPSRQAPLDGAALRAALLDGLRFHALETGSPTPDAARMVEQQLAAIRRACKRIDPPGVRTLESPQPGAAVRPPLALAPEPEPEAEPPQLPWWQRD